MGQHAYPYPFRHTCALVDSCSSEAACRVRISTLEPESVLCPHTENFLSQAWDERSSPCRPPVSNDKYVIDISEASERLYYRVGM